MKPSKLKPNDLVAIVSPSGTVAYRQDKIKKACSNFEQATKLKTILAPNAVGHHYYSSGTIQQRIDDFHWAIKNPDVKAIIFSVGGDTAIELVDKLDYELIKQYPKIIAGISDATTLLNSINAQTGLTTFLGLEFLDFAEHQMIYESQAIKQAWFDGNVGEVRANPNWADFDDLPTSYKGWRTIKPGSTAGKIVGGNYTSFAQLHNTPYMPELKNCILVLEYYKQPKQAINRTLKQLGLWGIFDKINGLIVGYCLGSDNPNDIGSDRDLADILIEMTDNYNFPIIQIGEIGHNVENIMLPIGAAAKIDATNRSFEITETVVI